MRVEKFNAKSNSKVSALIGQAFPMLSFGTVKVLLKNKDVKINGKRISADEVANVGDEICFYVQDKLLSSVDIIFEDENIIVVNKPRKIEVQSDLGLSLEKMVSEQTRKKVYAVHRLDLNTTGLVVFAKNQESKTALDDAFKRRTIEKFYLALVAGNMENKSEKMTAYLSKDDRLGKVKILDFPQKSYEKIETWYDLVQNYENFALVRVELVTGKTHQIRAHFAHIGHPILGDEKYGDFKINSEMKLKYQCLTAEKMIFHFEKTSPLAYLDKTEVSLPQEKIDFLKYCK